MGEPPMDPADCAIVYRQRCAAIGRTRLRAFAEELASRLCRGRGFSTLLSGDREIRLLNRQFRGQDQATDVLSFPAGGAALLGDIAISYDHARCQAREFGHTIETEVKILMLHGVLHLVGFDHETDSGEMLRGERRWRRHFDLPLSLLERTGS
jgi:probable rRNA maturation factor